MKFKSFYEKYSIEEKTDLQDTDNFIKNMKKIDNIAKNLKRNKKCLKRKFLT